MKKSVFGEFSLASNFSYNVNMFSIRYPYCCNCWTVTSVEASRPDFVSRGAKHQMACLGFETNRSNVYPVCLDVWNPSKARFCKFPAIQVVQLWSDLWQRKKYKNLDEEKLDNIEVWKCGLSFFLTETLAMNLQSGFSHQQTSFQIFSLGPEDFFLGLVLFTNVAASN